jgi:DNA-binding response OmpR family regulator
LDVCADLRRGPLPYSVPILMMTGSVDVFGESECLRAGADGYVAKPFDLGDLKTRIDAFLSYKRDFSAARARDARSLSAASGAARP